MKISHLQINWCNYSSMDSQPCCLFFWLCRFTLSGKILGSVGGQSCLGQDEGPAGVKVSLTPIDGGEPIASLLTSKGGSYKFENLLTGSVGHLEIIHKDQKVFPSVCSLCTSSMNNLNPSTCVS